MKHLRIAARAASILALMIASTGEASAGPADRFDADITLGYESFIDRFTILEEDTSDAVQELFISLGSRLRLDGGTGRFDAYNTLRYGNQAISDYFDATFASGSKRATYFELRNSLRLKYYQDSSDYEFGNDYVQSNTMARLGRALGGDSRVSIRGRMERIDYSERSAFDYDYLYLDGGLEVETGSYFGNYARLAGTAGHRSVPDTTDLSYDRTIAEAELHFQPSGMTMFELSVSGDRRRYEGDARSPLWNLYSYASLSLSPPGGTRYALRFDSESYIYDEPSTTFFDTHFVRTGLRSTFPVKGSVSVSAEPRFARMFCSDFREERYWEGSVALGLDVMGGRDYWLSLSWEPGRRDYLLVENDIYSDFYFSRLSVMGSLRTRDGTTIGLFVMHDPERHSRRDDDFSITMISATVTREF